MKITKEWQAAIAHLEGGRTMESLSLSNLDRHAIDRALSQIAADAAAASAYLGARGLNCGADVGHERAMLLSEKAAKAVRKAMGFTYP